MCFGAKSRDLPRFRGNLPPQQQPDVVAGSLLYGKCNPRKICRQICYAADFSNVACQSSVTSIAALALRVIRGC